MTTATHPTIQDLIAATVAQQREEIAAGKCICQFPGQVCGGSGGVETLHEVECLEHRKREAELSAYLDEMEAAEYRRLGI